MQNKSREIWPLWLSPSVYFSAEKKSRRHRGAAITRLKITQCSAGPPAVIPVCVSCASWQGDKVNYERFRTWLLQNKEAFTLSRWLLSGGVCVTLTDDSDTPTFYQTLAGVTHCKFTGFYFCNTFSLIFFYQWFSCLLFHPLLNLSTIIELHK